MKKAIAYDVSWMPPYGLGILWRFLKEDQGRIGRYVQSFMRNEYGVITVESVQGHRETILTIICEKHQ